jgi:hypothetical protein
MARVDSTPPPLPSIGTSIPNMPMCFHLYSTRNRVPLATSLRDFADRESTIQVFVVVENPETPNAETPKSDFSGSRATCPCPDQRLPLIREIATRDFNEHEILASSNAEARYADIRWSVPFCAFGLTPAQLLHDPTVSGISRSSDANPVR